MPRQVRRIARTLSAIISALLMGFSPKRIVTAYIETIGVVKYSLITISSMLALGTLTRYAGVDATLGLAFAATGVLYPFFGTMLGIIPGGFVYVNAGASLATITSLSGVASPRVLGSFALLGLFALIPALYHKYRG